MDKIRNSITKGIQNLGDSFNSHEEDARMEDMSDFVLSPYEGSSSMESDPQVLVIPTKPQTRSFPGSDPTNDSDVIDSIDASYFVEDDFDAIGYELKKLYEVDLCLEDIERERMKLKTQLQIVSKKISVLIMEKSPSYSSQLEDMDSIRDGLTDLIVDVRTVRSALRGAKSKSVTTLRILANEKTKQLLWNLKETLLTIKTLHETEYQMREAIEEGKFPLAIRICVEAKEAATTYRHFNCISDLMNKLASSSTVIEKELDDALASLTLIYDPDRYVFVYTACSMLGKVEQASRKLVSFFGATLERSARTVLMDKCSQKTGDFENISYEGLCETVDSDQVLTTIRELGFIICKVLSIYHTILRFHTEEQQRKEIGGTNSDPDIMQSYMTSCLFHVFKLALSKFNTLICAQDFSNLKFDHILDIVDMTNRLRRFGRAFFGHSSAELAVSLEKQTVMYFCRYHRERMEELRMFLENECFTVCPVPHQFIIFDLQDFQFLKESRDEVEDTLINNTEGIGEQLDFVMMPLDYCNPFASHEVKSRHQSMMSVSSVDETDSPGAPDTPRSEKQATPTFIEEPADHVPPNLCNTALNLLRFFGRYIRMTSLLPSISDESIPSVTQLFEFFFCSLCHLFASDGSENVERPARIQAVLTDIRGRLIEGGSPSSSVINGSPMKIQQSLRFTLPQLCCAVNLNYADQLFGAAERIVAVESAEFVARQLDLVRPVIESLIPPENVKLLTSLDIFYSQVLCCVGDMRQMVLDCVCSRALKLSVLVSSVSSTKWDINELHSQHSSYVDFLLQDLGGFRLRVEQVGSTVHVCEAVRALFWDRVIYYAFKALIQGFCEGGRCSTEGRALMQLDFQHLLIKLEPLCGLKPIPHTAYVDGFIKAFYLPESGLEQWITNHSEYTAKQMISLLGVATHVSKKAKMRIINALND